MNAWLMKIDSLAVCEELAAIKVGMTSFFRLNFGNFVIKLTMNIENV